MRFRPATALLCITLLLAGCAAFGGGATTDAPAETTTTTTATDAPAETTTTTATATRANASSLDADDYPPGVGPDGIANVTALRQANRDGPTRTGYTAVGTRNLTTEVETRNTSVRAAVGPGGFPYHVVTWEAINGSLDRETATWANETVSLTRYGRTASVEYRTRYRPDPADAPATEIGLFTAIEDGAWELASVEGTAGERRYRLAATGPDPERDRPPRASLTGYDGTLVLGEDGTVHRANVTVNIGTPNGTHTVRFAYGRTGSGATTVERPAWVEERIGQVLDVRVRATAVDDRFVRVENTGRAPIEPGSRFLLWYGGCGRATGELDAALDPGDAVYVYVLNGSNSRLGFNRTAPVGPARSMSHPSDFIVFPPTEGDERPDPIARADVAEAGDTNATTSGSAALSLEAGATRSGSATGC